MKNQVKKFLLRTRLLRIKELFLPKSLLILYYHSVSERREEQNLYITDGVTAEATVFRRQMEFLRKHYNPITLQDVADWIGGKKEIPNRSVAITFDDGFEDNYSLAAPIMEEFDIRGTFYLTAGCVERQTLPWFCKMQYLFHKGKSLGLAATDPETGISWNLTRPDEFRAAWLHYVYPCAKLPLEEQNASISRLEKILGISYDPSGAPKMMSWPQADELIRRGHIIGNHTFSHPNVAHLTPENQASEIELSHRLLSERLEIEPRHFSYPHPCLDPQWDVRSQSIIRDAGYETIVLTEEGRVARTCSPFRLTRITVGNWDEFSFEWKLETAFAGIEV